MKRPVSKSLTILAFLLSVAVSGARLFASGSNSPLLDDPGPRLGLAGECPGDVLLQITGATPNEQVNIGVGYDTGLTTPIPGDACEGTEVDLDNPRLLFGPVAVDAGGRHTEVRSISAADCGKSVQAVEVNPNGCLTSLPEILPAPEPPAVCRQWHLASLDGPTNPLQLTYGNEVYVSVGPFGMMWSIDGEVWTPGQGVDPVPELQDVVFDGDEFVAVGPDSVVIVSVDGRDWETRPFSTPLDITTVAYASNEGTYIVGGKARNGCTQSGIYVSTDLTSGSWDLRLATLPPQEPLAAASDGSQFVVFGEAGYSYTSSPGVSGAGVEWISHITFVPVADSLVWTGDGYVGVTQSNAAVTSDDGLKWTAHHTAFDEGAGRYPSKYGVAWTGNGLVAVGAEGTIATSHDGKEWIEENREVSLVRTVASRGDQVVALTDDRKVWRSDCPEADARFEFFPPSPMEDEPILFSDRSITNPEDWTWDFGDDSALEYGVENPIHTYEDPGTYTVTLTVDTAAGPSDTSRVVTVSAIRDANCGRAWNLVREGGPDEDELLDVAHGNGTHVAVGRKGTVLWSDDAFGNWAAGEVSVETTEDLWDVIHLGDVFLAAGDNGTILSSTDGRQWDPVPFPSTEDLDMLGWNGTTLIAGGATKVYSSFDRFTWVERPKASAARDALWNGDEYLMIGGGATLFISESGISWTDYFYKAGSLRWESMAWNGRDYAAVSAESGHVIRSDDGFDWFGYGAGEDIFKPEDGYLFKHDIEWAGDHWIAVGLHETIATSPDLVNWTEESPGVGSNFSLRSVAWDGLQAVVVGQEGRIWKSDECE